MKHHHSGFYRLISHPASRRLAILALLVFIGTASPVLARPEKVFVTPPDGARFLVGQKFDIRVEGEGKGPFYATLKIDNVEQTFTSGKQGSNETDGITEDGWGGFNLRGYWSEKVGTHKIVATFRDSTGAFIGPDGKEEITATFEIINVTGDSRPAKNIIIMLGDGMGAAHRTAARIARYGVVAGKPKGWLAMDEFPGMGLVTTHSLDSIVTDSSPGMSCYSSGNHANNEQEGVFPAHVKNPFYAPRVEYMAEYLHRTKGKSLGLVTTADVQDATPAANAVHTANRTFGTGICDQYFDESDAEKTGGFGTGLTVLMGGGRRWFLPAETPGSKESPNYSSRSDSSDYSALPEDLINKWKLPDMSAGKYDKNRDLLADFKKAGFTYVDTFESLKTVGSPDRLLGLFAYGNMNTALDKIAKRRKKLSPGAKTFVVDDYHAPDQPMLDEMTKTALEVLKKNDKGFVLMVEGAHIDKQSHLMDADRVINEVIEFDRAVAEARRFAETNGDTIVIVIADHECSGFSLFGAFTDKINVYAEARFPRYDIKEDGYPETLDIKGKLVAGFGASADRYESWKQKALPIIDGLLPAAIKDELIRKGYPKASHQREEGAFIGGQIPGRGQAVHTAVDIPVSSFSSGSDAYQLFYGVQENTDVFFKLMCATLGGFKQSGSGICSPRR